MVLILERKQLDELAVTDATMANKCWRMPPKWRALWRPMIEMLEGLHVIGMLLEMVRL